MQPDSSVVTSVYNGERFFDRALPSILAQSRRDFEYVIVDDGSTDNTLALLREVADRDSRLKVIEAGRIGRSRALNIAVENARGKYLFQQDFDDISHAGRLETEAAYLDAHPDVGVVGGSYVVNDLIRRERYVRRPPTDHKHILRGLAKSTVFANTTVAIRRDAWVAAGGWPEVDDIQDLTFWVRVAAAGWKLGGVSDVLGEHFVYPNSSWHRSMNYWQRQVDLARVQRMAVRELELPAWMMIYSVSRYGYAILPAPAKRLIRRTLGGAMETDIPFSPPVHTDGTTAKECPHEP